MSVKSQKGIPVRPVISQVMHGVVQIVALRRRTLGNYAAAWTGSGTIIDPSGIILTNCHVANPRALGMPAPAVDVLGIAILETSDQPPALTYLAEVLAQWPERDLALLRIVAGLDGKKVSGLKLPAVPLGDSDALELGDTLSIFGFPGIGGETVTFTSGAVSGFGSEKGVDERRAWIKTDATIAGGNSGGTAVNEAGQLIGIPTQAAAGSGIQPVDARPVVDTTGDGRVDEQDTPMSIGGFINGLRPVNLAKPLLSKAGVKIVAGAQPAVAPSTVPSKPAPSKPAPAAPAPSKPAPAAPTPSKPVPGRTGLKFTPLVFSGRVTNDGRPVQAAEFLPSGSKELYAITEFEGMKDGTVWSVVWALNQKTIAQQQDKWTDGQRGRKVLRLATAKGLPDGEYHLAITVQNQIVTEGRVTVGRYAKQVDTQLSGTVVDQQTGKGIADALVIALQPAVRVQDFVKQQRKEMAFTTARSDKQGRFTFEQRLPRGQAYGLVVVARGYRDLAIESALRISAKAPDQAQMNAIPMTKG